jgi:hypothetical protein
MSNVKFVCYPDADNKLASGVDLDLMEGFDIELTYTIQDAQDITRRSGTYSKTITLPSTTRNDNAFRHAYNVQSFVGGFTPNKRIDCAVWGDGVQIFSGSMQLMAMRVTRGVPTYEISIYGESVSLFSVMGETLLASTAGVDTYDHEFNNLDVIVAGNANSATSGYCYAYIDAEGNADVNGTVPTGTLAPILNLYGYIAPNLVPIYQWRPCYFAKMLVDKIFAQHGYRYESNFLSSSGNVFSKLVVPWANDWVLTSNSDINGNVSGSTTLTVATGGTNVTFPTNNTAPFTLSSGIVVSADTYFRNDDTVAHGIELNFDAIASGTPSVANVLRYEIKYINPTGPVYTAQRSLFGEMQHNWRTTIYLQPQQSFYIVCTRLATMTGGATITNRRLTLKGTTMGRFNTISMQKGLPMDVRQIDFLQDLQKMFNLYFYQSPLDPKLIYIEPFTSFYGGSVLDWSQKSDENAEMTVLMGDPSSKKRYVFKYADGGDALGKLYQSEFKEGYGSRIYDSDNYNRSGDQVIDLKAKTLIPAQYTTNLIAGRGFDTDGNGNPRSLQLGYRLALHSGYVQPNNTGLNPTFLFYYGQVYSNSVPSSVINVASAISLATHLQNPYDTSASGNFDLSFGIPRRIYYRTYDVSGNPMSYNNNNLFNNFWNGYIFELTSKQAMTVECTMLLTSTDIATLDFRNLIYWKGINWRLLEIKDYAVGQSKLCRVTMRRVLPIDAFVPTTLDPTFSDDPTAKTDGEINASIYAPVTMLDLNEGKTVAIPLLPDDPTS